MSDTPATLSADGHRVAAPIRQDYSYYGGGVAIWVKVGVEWKLEQTIVVPHDEAWSDSYMSGLCLKGNLLLIGSYMYGGVLVYTHNPSTGVWELTDTLGAEYEGDYYAGWVTIANDTRIATAGWIPLNSFIVIWDLVSGTWTPTTIVETDDGLFHPYKLAFDGPDRLIAGDPSYTSNQGRAYVYARSGSSWDLVQTIEAPDPAASLPGFFGRFVSADQGALAISAGPYSNSYGQTIEGRVYVYSWSGSQYDLEATFGDPHAGPDYTTPVHMGDQFATGEHVCVRQNVLTGDMYLVAADSRRQPYEEGGAYSQFATGAIFTAKKIGSGPWQPAQLITNALPITEASVALNEYGEVFFFDDGSAGPGKFMLVYELAPAEPPGPWPGGYCSAYGQSQYGPPTPYGYCYPKSTGAVRNVIRVPLGAFYIDHVELVELSRLSPADPVICNRFPPPPIEGGIETSNGPFDLSTGVNALRSLTVETGRHLVRQLTPDAGDSISRLTHIIRAGAGGFVSGFVGDVLQINGSTVGNNRDYHISHFIDANRVVVEEEPVADETGHAIFDADMHDGVYVESFQETCVFFLSDFVDPAAATATEIVAAILARMTYARARTSCAGSRVRLLSNGHDYVKIVASPTSHLVRAATGSDEDRIFGAARRIYCKNGNFIGTDAGHTFYISNSNTTNNHGFTITEVEDAQNIVVLEQPVDEGPRNFLNGATPDGVYAEALGLSLKLEGDETLDEALETDSLTFSVFAPDDSEPNQVQVYVRTAGVQSKVYDYALSFTAPGWHTTVLKTSSLGSSIQDIWDVTLTHDTPFVSEEIVEVLINTGLGNGHTASATHIFKVCDYLPPVVTTITPWSRQILRVRFSEPMQTSEDYGPASILHVRDVSGRVSYYQKYNIGTIGAPSWKYNVVEAPVAKFVASEVGLFLGSAGARNARNNGTARITEWLSAGLVCIDTADMVLVDEDPADPRKDEPSPTVTVGPYRIVAAPSPAGVVQPVFVPIVTSAALPDVLTLKPDEVQEQYVQLELQDDLTASVDYVLEITRVEDQHGNQIGSLYPFTSWVPDAVPNRSFSLWDMIPDMNKREDVTQDLEKTIRSLDEAAQIMLADVDQFGLLLDPMRTKDSVVDTLLEHLGNPLVFVRGLSLAKKRDLIPLLVPMYKKRGVAIGIEDSVAFFVGKTVRVVPFDLPLDTWTLGVALLGYNTFIGPSRSVVRYSFYLEHVDDLTAEEESNIKEIVEFVRPAHTHFIGFSQVEALAWTSTHV